MAVRRFRARLAYDGTGYSGFQRQAKAIPTIQAEVETAIVKVTAQTVTVIGAGRTDTGVHATGQVIAFDVEWAHSDQALLAALNQALPEDIALQDIRQQEGFHPRFDAVSRIYKYSLCQSPVRQPLLRNRAWHIYHPLNGDIMARCAALLIGRQNFAALGKPSQGDNTVRTIHRAQWERSAAANVESWTFTVEADGFLQHMVRRMVSWMVAAGLGRLSVERFAEAVQQKTMLHIALAPPQGLALAQVKYVDE